MTGDPEAAGTQPAETKPNDQLGRVSLDGISGYGYHGVLDFERARGQRFVVDVSCSLDLSAAAESDDLTRTLDYQALAAAIVADIEGQPLNLIEALAGRIARTCLRAGPVDTVQVTVHKPDAPIRFAPQSRAAVADVAVTLTRSA